MTKYQDFKMSLQENANTLSVVSKDISELGGKKINLARKQYYILNVEYEDGTYGDVTWAKYKKLNVPIRTNDIERDKGYIKALLMTIKQFNKQVDALKYSLQFDKGQLSFNDTIDNILKSGAKIPKTGLVFQKPY